MVAFIDPPFRWSVLLIYCELSFVTVGWVGEEMMRNRSLTAVVASVVVKARKVEVVEDNVVMETKLNIVEILKVDSIFDTESFLWMSLLSAVVVFVVVVSSPHQSPRCGV